MLSLGMHRAFNFLITKETRPFSPHSCFCNFRYLSVSDDWREKNPEQRALLAQKIISTELGVPALKLTCHDVNEYKKTVVKQLAKPIDIDSLVRQVIEVLPNIPESEIRADLSKYIIYAIIFMIVLHFAIFT